MYQTGKRMDHIENLAWFRLARELMGGRGNRDVCTTSSPKAGREPSLTKPTWVLGDRLAGAYGIVWHAAASRTCLEAADIEFREPMKHGETQTLILQLLTSKCGKRWEIFYCWCLHVLYTKYIQNLFSYLNEFVSLDYIQM